MQETTLFHIENLYCSYNKQKEDAVLFIDSLDIPKDKIVFLLGASGCGKSTLLETLGLMNDTVAEGLIELNDNLPIDITTLWKTENQHQLNAVRKKHYSFIFQNTNLMENFTAYENVCLSAMIKDGVQQKEVLEQAQNLMDKIKLPQHEVGLDTLAVNLSGGQRQRLAFARAFNNSATVLFGDEPTGNLDEANANELFNIIKSNLHEGLSAIIVSHDINLAVKFADEIIVLTKNASNNNIGQILPENIFKRPSWEGFNQDQIDSFKSKIRSLYKTGNEAKIITNTSNVGKVNTNITYKDLFLNKEASVLFGKKFQNLVILSLILFFTFLSIGFANGSLEYLRRKMDNAFVNWITIMIPTERSREASDISKLLNSEEFRKRYDYNNVTQFNFHSFFTFDCSNKTKVNGLVNSRSINLEEDGKFLKEDILSEENVISGNKLGFKNKQDLGLIVTKKYLEENHYPPDASFIYARYTKASNDSNSNKSPTKYLSIPIPINAVVKKLPDVEVIYTDFFNSKFNVVGSSMFDIETFKKDIDFFCKNIQSDSANSFTKVLYAKFEADSLMNFYQPIFSSDSYTVGDQKGSKISCTLEPKETTTISIDTINIIALKIESVLKNLNKNIEIQRFYDYASNNDQVDRTEGADQFSVYFENLSKVRQFKYFFDSIANPVIEGQTGRIEVNVTKVDEKENFFFLSNVTKAVAFLLVVFSILATSLFLSNLLKGHLSKVRMNIGTFQAIGLDNKQTLLIYFRIILKFISIALLLSILLSSFFGFLCNFILKHNIVMQEKIEYFRIVDKNTLFTVVALLISAFIVSWRTINKMLNKTPGDLIYNR